MDLIKCPKCNGENRNTEDTCIHCGYDLNSTNYVKGKVRVHGYPEWYIYNPQVKIYDNDTFIGAVKRKRIWEGSIDHDTFLYFKCMSKTVKISVEANEQKDIFLSLDRYTGSLIATSSDDDFSQSHSKIKNYTKDEYANGRKSSKTNTWVKVVAIGLIVWFVGFIWYAFSPMTESKACSVVQSYVKNQMRDPSSAKFGNDCYVTKNSTYSNLWYVQGSVRGTNGFGGVAVQKYRVTMNVNGSSYRVVDVSFNW